MGEPRDSLLRVMLAIVIAGSLIETGLRLNARAARVAVPLLIPGFATDAWSAVTPLVSLVAVPMVPGVASRTATPVIAERLSSIVRCVTAIDTAHMLSPVSRRHALGARWMRPS